MRALRQLGISVEIIKQPVDLLVCHRGITALMEVKGSHKEFTKSQVEFIARWPGVIHVVRNADDAVRAVIGEEVMR